MRAEGTGSSWQGRATPPFEGGGQKGGPTAARARLGPPTHRPAPLLPPPHPLTRKLAGAVLHATVCQLQWHKGWQGWEWDSLTDCTLGCSALATLLPALLAGMGLAWMNPPPALTVGPSSTSSTASTTTTSTTSTACPWRGGGPTHPAGGPTHRGPILHQHHPLAPNQAGLVQGDVGVGDVDASLGVQPSGGLHQPAS